MRYLKNEGRVCGLCGKMFRGQWSYCSTIS